MRRHMQSNWFSRKFASSTSGLWAMAILLIAFGGAKADPPAVSSLYPAGVQHGQSVDVTVNGNPGTAPVQALTESEGLTLSLSEDGKTLTATATEVVTPGLHWIRFHNAEGAGDLRPFVVGALPELNETEPNNSHDDLTATDLPVVVNGILNQAGDVDTFAVALDPGQTLIASVESHRSLSTPMDGIVQILSPGGFVVEQNDDDHGFDPQLVFTAEESGLHFVRVFGFPAAPNSTVRFAGGGDYIYRLTLTTGPFIDHLAPGGADALETISVVGWNLPSANMTIEEALQIPGLHEIRPFTPGTPIAVSESSGPAAGLPLRVVGHLSAPGEFDSYQFSAVEGQPLKIAVQSRALERPLDALVRIIDDTGKQLQETDDASRNVFDPALTWKAPADGTYTIEVHDRFGHGSQRHVYDLSIVPEQPVVELHVTADHFKVKPGESLEVEVTINRQGGYAAELQIAVEALPEGVTCAAVTSPGEGDASKSVKLNLEAAAETAFSGPLRIVATGGEAETVIATAPLKLAGARTESLWLTVGP